MRTFSLYQEFDVALYEAEQWNYPAHGHSFFEIIYVLEGEGLHLLNNNHYPYQTASLFLLTPNDVHSFDIKNKSRFCIISFNKIYFSNTKSNSDALDLSELFKKLEIIFYNASYVQGEFVENEEDKALIGLLVKQLIKEMKTKRPFFETIIQNCLFLLLNLIARSIQQQLTANLKNENPTSEIGEMLSYIQQHIYNKEKLKIEVLAHQFYKSKNYISQYFKAHTGQSLKDYIVHYKLNLVKNRLRHSDMTILQIADELGFTDESHLNKLFRQVYGQTAKEFKKANK